MTLIDGKFRLVRPVATKLEWDVKNPILKLGETGYEVLYDDNQEIIFQRQKVGNGTSAWVDLPYTKDEVITEDYYFDEAVGGIKVTDNLKNKSALDIIKLIARKYLQVSLTTLTVKVGAGIPASLVYLPLGRSVINPILYYSIENSSNLLVGNNAKIIRSGASDEIYNTIGVANKTITATLSFSSSTNYTITLEITGKENEKKNKVVTLSWTPEVYYGSSSSQTLTTSGQVRALYANKLGNSRNGSYIMNGAGYSFLCIPTAFNLSNVVFKDPVTNLSYPMDYQDMLVSGAPRTVQVTNSDGVSFFCNILRSVYSLSNPSTLAVS